jgi:hypothetical protein
MPVRRAFFHFGARLEDYPTTSASRQIDVAEAAGGFTMAAKVIGTRNDVNHRVTSVAICSQAS